MKSTHEIGNAVYQALQGEPFTTLAKQICSEAASKAQAPNNVEPKLPVVDLNVGLDHQELNKLLSEVTLKTGDLLNKINSITVQNFPGKLLFFVRSYVG
jgi:hypothetical protein